MTLALEVGKTYRIRHREMGLFFGRCTVQDGDFVGFEVVAGNSELRLHAYEEGDGIYLTSDYFTIETGVN